MKKPGAQTLAEDLLLVLFQPDTGTIAGENTLHDMLAGAVLADLASIGSVTTTTTRTGSVRVEAVEGQPPSDEILRSAWDYVSNNPDGVLTMLAAIGPGLRQPLLERLVVRGDIREENGKELGMLKVITLRDGGSGRRSGLIGDIRNVLMDSVEPTPRTAALAALMWGSGTLQQFDPEIPWTPAVTARGREFARGNWSVEDATQAVTRATTTMSGIIAVTVLPR